MSRRPPRWNWRKALRADIKAREANLPSGEQLDYHTIADLHHDWKYGTAAQKAKAKATGKHLRDIQKEEQANG